MPRVDEHSRASVAAARLAVGTGERIVRKGRMAVDLKADLEVVASTVTTARPLAM